MLNLKTKIKSFFNRHKDKFKLSVLVFLVIVLGICSILLNPTITVWVAVSFAGLIAIGLFI